MGTLLNFPSFRPSPAFRPTVGLFRPHRAQPGFRSQGHHPSSPADLVSPQSRRPHEEAVSQAAGMAPVDAFGGLTAGQQLLKVVNLGSGPVAHLGSGTDDRGPIVFTLGATTGGGKGGKGAKGKTAVVPVSPASVPAAAPVFPELDLEVVKATLRRIQPEDYAGGYDLGNRLSWVLKRGLEGTLRQFLDIAGDEVSSSELPPELPYLALATFDYNKGKGCITLSEFLERFRIVHALYYGYQSALDRLLLSADYELDPIFGTAEGDPEAWEINDRALDERIMGTLLSKSELVTRVFSRDSTFENRLIAAGFVHRVANEEVVVETGDAKEVIAVTPEKVTVAFPETPGPAPDFSGRKGQPPSVSRRPSVWFGGTGYQAVEDAPVPTFRRPGQGGIVSSSVLASSRHAGRPPLPSAPVGRREERIDDTTWAAIRWLADSVKVEPETIKNRRLTLDNASRIRATLRELTSQLDERGRTSHLNHRATLANLAARPDIELVAPATVAELVVLAADLRRERVIGAHDHRYDRQSHPRFR